MWPGNKQECSYYIEVEGLEVEERAGKRTFSLYITVIGSVLSAGNIKKKESYGTVITCTVYRISGGTWYNPQHAFRDFVFGVLAFCNL